MHRWTVGVVDVVRIEDLDFSLASDRPAPEWCIPDLAPSPDEVGLAFSVIAIATDGVRIVVDPWMANDGPREQPDAAAHGDRLLEQLASAGFPPDDVDIVVNTHLDGIGWNTRLAGTEWVPSFPRARYLYPAAEVAAIEGGEPMYGHEAFALLDATVGVERIEPPVQLTDSVSLVDAPGHNWGHVGVRIESLGELAVYPGHLVLTPWQVDDPADTSSDEPRQASVAAATRRAVLDELADRHGLLLTTLLGGSGGGSVVRTGEGRFALA